MKIASFVIPVDAKYQLDMHWSVPCGGCEQLLAELESEWACEGYVAGYMQLLLERGVHLCEEFE